MHIPSLRQKGPMALLILALILALCDGGNILMYLPITTRSHQNAWTPVARGLALAGHSVTIVTTIPTMDYPPGITEILITSREFSAFCEDYSGMMVSTSAGLWDGLQIIRQGGEVLIKVHKAALNHPRVQDILHNHQQWDLVIASPLFNEMGVMLGNLLHA